MAKKTTDDGRPILRPHEGTPQEQAIDSDADVVILGGANGGGLGTVNLLPVFDAVAALGVV